MKKRLLTVIAFCALAAAGVTSSAFVAGAGAGSWHPFSTSTNGHTPVTICHKPGTPAEQTLVVDDDAVSGHLGHGDYLGACQENTTTTTTTSCEEDEDCNQTTTTVQTTTTNGCDEDQCETTTTVPATTTTVPETTSTTVDTNPCPSGHTTGKDGQPGNDDCALTTSTATTTTTATTATTTTTPPPSTTTTEATTTTTATPPTTSTPTTTEASSSSGGGSSSKPGSATPTGNLPFTGLELWVAVAAGLLMLAAGLTLRRLKRR